MKTEDIEKDLKLNFKEFLESGNEELDNNRYNAAISSYFKAIAILCDLKIYQTKRILPKNHSERFLFLKINFKDVSEILENLFKTYTDSYNLRMSKKDAISLKENVEKIKDLFGFKEAV
ncbi:MAG: hypothetical protein KJ623_02940 [Nanoarchaeota archaeon]|nr:hypothetical protein [Nanoarchaeota archaeon]MBU0963236.1 hypothetical protein [Nanoarchaeota archaeon]